MVFVNSKGKYEEKQVIDIYPQLKGLKFSHHWGGPVSITADLAPVIGYLDRKKWALFSLGLMGHGVSMALWRLAWPDSLVFLKQVC